MIDTLAAIEHFKGLGCSWKMDFSGGILTGPTKSNTLECFETLGRGNQGASDVFDDAIIDIQRRTPFVKLLRKRTPLHKLHRSQNFTREDYMLLPYCLYGFALNAHKWYPLSIHHFSSTRSTGNLDPLTELVLPEGYKNHTLALAHSIDYEYRSTSDLQQNSKNSKGSGSRSILLQGSSGTGRRTFVEAIADRLGRPLFPISYREIANIQEGMNTKLKTWVSLVQRWRCVVLLDEVGSDTGYLQLPTGKRFLLSVGLIGQNKLTETLLVLRSVLQMLREFSGLIFLKITDKLYRQAEQHGGRLWFLPLVNLVIPFEPLSSTKDQQRI